MTQPTKYTITAAARIANKSATTIREHIRKGDLSFTQDKKGRRWIDASELYRVYDDDCDFERGKTNKTSSTDVNHSEAEREIVALQDQLRQEQGEREREQQQLQDQIDFLRRSLEKSQEGHNRATLLLEHKSQDHDRQQEQSGLWQKELEELKMRVANQETETKKYRNALIEERRKPWWAKLLGVEKSKKRRKSKNLPPQAQSFQG